jgi:hypothetical protein
VWLEGSTWKNRCIYKRIRFKDISRLLIIKKRECRENSKKVSRELVVGISFYLIV